MKISETLHKAQRKKENKKKRKQFLQKALYTLIGIPLQKIGNYYLNVQTAQWEKNEEKSKQKVVKEIVNYIKKELVTEDECYYIYNSWRSDEIDYGNCLCLHYFPYETKHNKQFKIFNRVFMEKRGEARENYYRYFFQALQDYFSAYEDIEVSTGMDKKFYREYEYIKLTMKKDR